MIIIVKNISMSVQKYWVDFRRRELECNEHKKHDTLYSTPNYF
jgi:hypothetical protein